MMVARMLDPPTLELHNEYISSMVSRLESDPTSDVEPPKKRSREIPPQTDLCSFRGVSSRPVANLKKVKVCVKTPKSKQFDLGQAPGDLMLLDSNPLDDQNALAAFDFNETDFFDQAAVAMETGPGDALTFIEGEAPWCGPPGEEEDGPSLCTRLGRLPTSQELAQRLMAVACAYKLHQVSQGAVDALANGLQVFVKASVEHLLVRKLPFRCSQNYRVKLPFCNEPHSLDERLYVNPLHLQQQKLFTRRASAEQHVSGSCDLLCPDAHPRAFEFFTRRSRVIQDANALLRLTLQDLHGLAKNPEPTVVNRAAFQTSYHLIPENRNRMAVKQVLLNGMVRQQVPALPDPISTIAELDESDEEEVRRKS